MLKKLHIECDSSPPQALTRSYILQVSYCFICFYSRGRAVFEELKRYKSFLNDVEPFMTICEAKRSRVSMSKVYMFQTCFHVLIRCQMSSLCEKFYKSNNHPSRQDIFDIVAAVA